MLTEPINSRMVDSEAIVGDRKPDHKNCLKTGVHSMDSRTVGVNPVVRQ